MSFKKKRNKDRNTLLSIRNLKVFREKRHYSHFYFDHIVFLFTDSGSLLTLRHISLFTPMELNVTFVVFYLIILSRQKIVTNSYRLFSFLQTFITGIILLNSCNDINYKLFLKRRLFNTTQLMCNAYLYYFP